VSVAEGTQLRHAVTCLDGRRVPVSAEERSDRQGPYPYWGANGVVDTIDGYLFDEPLVLLGEDGAPFFDPTKQVAFCVSGPIWVNNHIHVLRTRPGFDPRFVAHCLNVTDYGPWIGGTTRDKLTQDDMACIPIPDLPLSRQHAIADYLDAVTRQIDDLVARLSALGAAMQERHSAYRDELLTHHGQPARRLSTLLTAPISDGPHETPEFADIGVPFLSVDNLVADGLSFEGCRMISEDAYRLYARKSRPQLDDVLVTKAAAVGKVALVETTQVFHVWSPLAILRPDPALVLPAFLHFALLGSHAQSLMKLASTSNTQQNLAMRDLSALRLSVPPLARQAEVVELVRQSASRVQSVLSAVSRQVKLLQERRQALITAAVTGEIEIPGVAA